jgi:hypothetical protein
MQTRVALRQLFDILRWPQDSVIVGLKIQVPEEDVDFGWRSASALR